MRVPSLGVLPGVDRERGDRPSFDPELRAGLAIVGGMFPPTVTPDLIDFMRVSTIEMASSNHLPAGMGIKMLPGVGATATAATILPVSKPRLSNDAEFFPGMPKSWALTFMINDEDAPTGRPAGSLAWAGLANCYYWIDRKTGVGGYWATQIFPFADPTSVVGYLDMEAAVYANRR